MGEKYGRGKLEQLVTVAVEWRGDRSTFRRDELAEELGLRAPLDNQSYVKGSWAFGLGI